MKRLDDSCFAATIVERVDVAYEMVMPDRLLWPLVVSSPHSGRAYPADFLAETSLSLPVLRRAEDAFIDLLLSRTGDFGIPRLQASLPRSFIDLNREAAELDPGMFEGAMPPNVNSRSSRVAAGLGVIPRIAATGEAIYRRRLPASEIGRRLILAYNPYHLALRRMISDCRAQFGLALLLDCHSMPSAAYPGDGEKRSRLDFVLGDNHGTACSQIVVRTVAEWLRDQGYRVSLNQPYAGGFTTQTYASPSSGLHVLQIEVNRALYMDELRVVPMPGFVKLRDLFGSMVAMIGELLLAHPGLRQREAAE